MTDLIIHTPDDEEGGSLLDLLNAAKKQYDLAFDAYKKSVEHVWCMGKILVEARQQHKILKKAKGKNTPNWESLLDQFGISIASDNRARRLFQNCPKLNEITGLSIMEAYEEAGIPKPHPTVKKKPQQQSDSKPNPEQDDRKGSPSDQEEDDDRDDDNIECESNDDDEIEDEEIPDLDRLMDFEADFGLLHNQFQFDALSADEIKAALSSAELIADYAVNIQMLLSKRLDRSA